MQKYLKNNGGIWLALEKISAVRRGVEKEMQGIKEGRLKTKSIGSLRKKYGL